MNTIPTKQIDGDVSIGRNVAIGGDVSLSGSGVVNHNLRVKGWLEAKNIKGVSKGLYRTEGSLKSSYPRPEKGWYAFVGETLPAELWISEEGKWIDSGNKCGEPTISSELYDDLFRDFEDLKRTLSDFKEFENEVWERFETLTERVNDCAEDFNTFYSSVGKAGGIAPLDSEGKIAAEYLPEDFGSSTPIVGESVGIGVLPYFGVQDDVVLEQSSYAGKEGKHYFAANLNLFVHIPESSDSEGGGLGLSPGLGTSQGSGIYISYDYNENTPQGMRPRSDALFLDASAHALMIWNGSELTPILADSPKDCECVVYEEMTEAEIDALFNDISDIPGLNITQIPMTTEDIDNLLSGDLPDVEAPSEENAATLQEGYVAMTDEEIDALLM